jgi:hypothetical protein
MQKSDFNPGLGLETSKSYHCTATLVVKNFGIYNLYYQAK